MVRPETWTAAALVVIGIGVAIWLAAGRPPATPAPPAEPEIELAAIIAPNPARLDLFGAVATDPAAGLGADGLPCGPGVAVEPLEDSLVRAVVLAPCQVGAPVTITYGPITFAAEIDAKGLYTLRLPSLGAARPLTAAFGNGKRVQVSVPEGEPRVLVGLSWAGQADLDLVIDEYGRRLSKDVRGSGHLFHYGHSDERSAIYVAPKGRARGTIRIGVNVTPGAACGSDLAVTAFDTLLREVHRRDVTIKLEDCSVPPAPFSLDHLLDDLGVHGPRG